MTNFEVVLPQWGFEMTEGTVESWLVHVGENVAEGDPLAEIETDKVTTTLESIVNGTLMEIRVPEGQTVPVRTVLAVIATSDVV